MSRARGLLDRLNRSARTQRVEQMYEELRKAKKAGGERFWSLRDRTPDDVPVSADTYFAIKEYLEYMAKIEEPAP